MINFNELALQMAHAISVQIECTNDDQPLYFLRLSTFYDVLPLKHDDGKTMFFTDLQSAESFATTTRRELTPTRSKRVQKIEAARKAPQG